MIGYILLITFAIVIAGVVYTWLKTYVPKQGLECPDGVSLYILKSDLNASELELTLRNNGKFNIDGVFIYYSNDSSQKIATKTLIDEINETKSGVTPFGAGFTFYHRELAPNEDRHLYFNMTGIDSIYSIEVIPIKQQETDTKKSQPVSCSDAKTQKILNYTITP